MNRKFLSNSNYVLSKILNDEKNIDISKKIIEDILDTKIKEIIIRKNLEERVIYLTAENHYGIANYRIVTEDNEELNVGIQIIDGLYVQEKMLIYASFIHANQEEYEEHNSFTKTITINILDGKFFPTKQYHNVITLLEHNKKYDIDKGMIFHLLELPKFKELEIERDEEAWIAYIKSDNDELVRKAKEKCTEIRKLDELLKDYWKMEKLK